MSGQVILEISEAKKLIEKQMLQKSVIQRNQGLIGFDVCSFETLDVLADQIGPFEKLWNLQVLWEKSNNSWSKDIPMYKLDLKDVESVISRN